MLNRVPVMFAAAAERGRTSRADGAHLSNLFAEVAPTSARSRIVLHGTPGSKLFSTIGTSPIFGLHPFNERAYVITGTGIYAVDSTGAERLVASVAISGICSIADNGVEMVFVDGFVGYVMTSGEVVKRITDPDFRRASSVTFMNGFFIFAAADSQQYFISGLYNGTTFDALDFASAESSPDNLLGVLNDHQELWLFGKKSIEIHFYNGTQDFPFSRADGGTIEHGCVSPFAFAKLDNQVYWLSNEGIVYRAAAQAAQRISTHAVEKRISEQIASWPSVTSYSYYEEGHAFFVLNVGNITEVYDASTGLWHTRSHIDHGRHIASTHVFVFDRHLTGDFSTGKVYEMSLDTYDDDGRPMIAEMASGPVGRANEYLRHAELEIDMEPGVGDITGPATDPLLALDWSDDDGATWSTERYAKIGRIGERRRRARYKRLGRAVWRRYRTRLSAPVKRAFLATAHVRVSL